MLKPKNWVNAAIALTLFFVPLVCSPVLADNYTVAKWAVIYLSAAVLALIFSIERLSFKSMISSRLYRILLLVVLLLVLSAFANWPGPYLTPTLDWVCFFVLTVAAYRSFLVDLKGERWVEWSTIASTILVLVYGFLQHFKIEPFPGLTHSLIPSSTFGFQNMTAEFIGLSTLFQLYFWREPQDQKRSFAREILLSLSFLFLYFTLSRASWLATAVALAPFAFDWSRSRAKSLLRIAILSGAFYSLTININPDLQNLSLKNPAFSETKAGNWEIRKIRWLNTLYMIADRPLGVGPSKFEFGYIPYHNQYRQDPESNESMVVRSPHNGYLEAGAESGWAAMIGVVIWIFLYIYELLRSPVRFPEERLKRRLVFAVTLFLTVDAFFAFPMENAFPFLVAALTLGVGLRLISGNAFSQTWTVHHRVWPVLAVIIVILGGTSSISKYFEFNYHHSYSHIARACNWFPDNWRACLRKADLEMKNEELDQAENTLRDILKRTPEHFVALRHLGYSYLSQGKVDLACEVWTQYDLLFTGKSSLHIEREKICR